MLWIITVLESSSKIAADHGFTHTGTDYNRMYIKGIYTTEKEAMRVYNEYKSDYYYCDRVSITSVAKGLDTPVNVFVCSTR